MLGKCPTSWGEDVYRYWQYRYNLKKVRLRLIMRFTAGCTGTFKVPVHDVPEHRNKATMASVLEVLVLECYGIDRAR